MPELRNVLFPPPSAGVPAALLRIVAGAALYGAVLGSWHGPRLALYVAVKLPLLLLLTALASSAFQTLVARSLGLALGRGAAAVWVLLFLLVSLQTATYLQPILWQGDRTDLFPRPRQFFVEHFFDAAERRLPE